jgi:hypothetical protein
VIRGGNSRRADDARGEHRYPAGEPERCEQRQRRAAKRQTAGPVRDRGEQEACDHRGAESEHQFVRMPHDGRERAAQRVAVHVCREPDGHRSRGPEPGQEEERAKARGKNLHARTLGRAAPPRLMQIKGRALKVHIVWTYGAPDQVH